MIPVGQFISGYDPWPCVCPWSRPCACPCSCRCQEADRGPCLSFLWRLWQCPWPHACSEPVLHPLLLGPREQHRAGYVERKYSAFWSPVRNFVAHFYSTDKTRKPEGSRGHWSLKVTCTCGQGSPYQFGVLGTDLRDRHLKNGKQ